MKSYITLVLAYFFVVIINTQDRNSYLEKSRVTA